MVENGSDPNACDERGETPLHAAMKVGHAEVAGELGMRGGKTYIARKEDGKTPVDLAQGKGEVRVSLLLRPDSFKSGRVGSG